MSHKILEACILTMKANHESLGEAIVLLEEELKAEQKKASATVLEGGWEDLPPTLNLAGACRVLNVSYNTLYKLMKDKRFPAVQKGGSWYVDTQKLKKYMGG